VADRQDTRTEGVKRLFVDMGDGTFAERIVAVQTDGSDISGGGGGGGGTEFAEDAAHASGALGTLTLVVRRDADTTLVDTDGDYAALQVDADGKLKVSGDFGATTGPATGTTTSVADQDTSILILATNASRQGATIYNDSTENLRLHLGADDASATVFSVILAGKADANSIGGYFEVPFGYTGEINGIWDAASTGSARITEFEA
jgi:hypothetical protein